MLYLHRAGSGPYGTLGILWNGWWPFCLTLEPVNPIPVGTYPISVYMSPKNGFNVYLLSDVPGYDMIEIHPGNTYADTAGCILVGNEIGLVNNVYAVMNSKKVFDNLMKSPKVDAIRIS